MKVKDRGEQTVYRNNGNPAQAFNINGTTKRWGGYSYDSVPFTQIIRPFSVRLAIFRFDSFETDFWLANRVQRLCRNFQSSILLRSARQLFAVRYSTLIKSFDFNFWTDKHVERGKLYMEYSGPPQHRLCEYLWSPLPCASNWYFHRSQCSFPLTLWWRVADHFNVEIEPGCCWWIFLLGERP